MVELWIHGVEEAGAVTATERTELPLTLQLQLHSPVFIFLFEPVLIEMSVDWEKVNERLPYKKGEEGESSPHHLCVTKSFCKTPIIERSTSAEGFISIL